LQALNVGLADFDQVVPYVTTILRNAMNDLLIKNTRISDIFQASFEDKKAHYATLVTNYFVIAFSFVIFVLLLFIYIFYYQANDESTKLCALTKLRPGSIQSLQQDFLAFRNIIFENNSYSDGEDPFYSESVKSIYHQGSPSSSKHAKQHQKYLNQYPISKSLWTGYYLSFLKLTLLISILLVLFLVDFILFKNYLNKLSTKVYQIRFIEQMNSRLSVLSGSFLEMISENDTTIIFNTHASDSLLIQIEQLNTIIGSVSETLGIGSSQDNALIQDVLYGDACEYLNSTSSDYAHCQKLANYQEKAGLVNLLSNFEALANSVYSKFINSDRSSETLFTLQLEVFNQMNTAIFRVLQSENKMIADVLNEDFDAIVNRSQLLNITLNTLILVLIVVGCFVIHFFIINRLKHKETQFRRILAMFPPSIVLPNFILKSYIIKTSNQNFSSFENLA